MNLALQNRKLREALEGLLAFKNRSILTSRANVQMEFDRAEKALALTDKFDRESVARKTLIWAMVVAVIFYLGIGCGCLLERSHWREEVVERG